MNTTAINVCSINIFGDDVRHFWMTDLEGLLDRYPDFIYPHKQDFYSLIITEETEGEVIIDNVKVGLDATKLIIVKPRCISSFNINTKAKGKIICFTEDFFSLRYNNNNLHQFTYIHRDANPYIRLSKNKESKWCAILKLMEEEFNYFGKESKKVLRSYLNILLFEFERMYNPTFIVKSKNLRQDKIHDFEVLIDKHFIKKKLPSEYARLMNISPNYLNKMCKVETGQTAGDIIRKRITVEAQRMLHYTNDSINEIAYKLGFDSTSYFITFFKNQTNIPPDQFRKNQAI
jgi:AraC family transcriptional activator of pobA